MQVKKFEAKTMKEALDLVKRHLGPEAIILSAKDNSRGFGLMGEKSVEVTAAISEETARRRRVAESRLSEKARSVYQSAPARIQREFIEKSAEADSREDIRVPTRERKLRYADIADDHASEPRPVSSRPMAGRRPVVAESRAMHASSSANVTANEMQSREIRDLKAEIVELKKIIEGFQKMPQTFVAMHPGADEGIHYDLSGMFQKLLRSGISQDLSVEIIREAQQTLPSDQIKRPAMVEAWVAKRILEAVEVVTTPFAERYQIFIGPAGQGKTSTLVKLASQRAIVEKKKIAIVSADSRKVGAVDQLKIYAQILNVPFACVRQASDWHELEERWGHIEEIFVDMPGYNLRQIEEAEHLRSLLPADSASRRVHYVLSALAKDEAAFETASRYESVGFDDLIFTGVDEAAQHGVIVNLQRKYRVPLHSFGTGPQIPEDIEMATKERVVDLIFKLSKLKKG